MSTRPKEDELDPDPAAFDKLSSRVRGRIALQQPTRAGLRLRRDQIPKIRERFQDVFHQADKELGGEAPSKAAFRWQGDSVRLTGTGLPGQNIEKLRDWLEGELASARDLFDSPPARTWDSGGKLSTLPEDWSNLGRSRPLVRRWRELAATGVALNLLDTQVGDAEPRLRPEYEVFPRLHLQRPDLGLLRCLAAEPFLEADPGTKFVVVHLQDLGVRCRVELGERRVQESIPLGNLIRQGDERVAQGRKLVDQGQVLVDQDYDRVQGRTLISDGNDLIDRGKNEIVDVLAARLLETIPDLASAGWSAQDPSGFQRAVVRCLLHSALESLGTEAVRQVLADDVGWSLGFTDAQVIHREFLKAIGDLGWFAHEAWRWSRFYPGHTPIQEGSGDQECPVLEEFEENWDGRSGQPIIGDLSRRYCGSPRFRPNDYEFHRWLRDDVMVDIVFELVYEGFQVAACEGEKIVVQVPVGDAPEARIESIIQAMATHRLQHIPIHRDFEFFETW